MISDDRVIRVREMRLKDFQNIGKTMNWRTLATALDNWRADCLDIVIVEGELQYSTNMEKKEIVSKEWMAMGSKTKKAERLGDIRILKTALTNYEEIMPSRRTEGIGRS